jgi:hypothetical protein
VLPFKNSSAKVKSSSPNAAQNCLKLFCKILKEGASHSNANFVIALKILKSFNAASAT